MLPEPVNFHPCKNDSVIFHGIGKTFCLWNPQSLLDTTDDVPVDKRLVEFHLSELGKKK
jgi:MraZ protein